MAQARLAGAKTLVASATPPSPVSLQLPAAPAKYVVPLTPFAYAIS